MSSALLRRHYNRATALDRAAEPPALPRQWPQDRGSFSRRSLYRRPCWDEVIALDATAEPRDEAHMSPCKKRELATLWKKEGLENVREAELTATLSFACFDDYWQPFLLGQGPVGAYVASLSNDARSALEERLRHRLVQGQAHQRIEMQARSWTVKGTVPQP